SIASTQVTTTCKAIASASWFTPQVSYISANLRQHQLIPTTRVFANHIGCSIFDLIISFLFILLPKVLLAISTSQSHIEFLCKILAKLTLNLLEDAQISLSKPSKLACQLARRMY